MNKHYIIWPIVMIAAFVAYFIQFDRQYAMEKAAQEESDKKVEAEKKAEKDRLKIQAQEENLKQTAIKAGEEAAKLAKKRAELEKKDQAVRDDTKTRAEDIAGKSKEKGLLEAKLAETRRARLKAESDAFDAARSVELAKIERRTIEMEIQRAAGLIAAKVDASSLVEIPVFAVETPPKK